MELPTELRAAIDEAASAIPQRELQALSEALSRRYRSESGTGRSLIGREAEVTAYAAVRMPATYAAVRSALSESMRSGLHIRTMLDVGAGAGAAGWAAVMELDELKELRCVEREAGMLRLGERLMRSSAAFDGIQLDWSCTDARDAGAISHADLVTASYMMNEMSPDARAGLLDRLWDAADQMLLIIEPGTPEGFAQLREARRRILERGGHVTAPCPHEAACPISGDDWCHFTCRVARSRLHRLIKGGDAPYEDEKFMYMAFTREDAARCQARVRRHPLIEPGRITLELCARDGLQRRMVTKRDKALFKAARKAGCGDAFGTDAGAE